MAAGIRLSELLEESHVVLPLAARDPGEVLLELAQVAEERGWVADAKETALRLHEREAMGTTAVGEEIAIPHAKVEGVARVQLLLGVSPRGISFGARDGRPTRLFFLVLSSPAAPQLHIQALAQVSRLARTPGLTRALIEAGSASEALARLREVEGGA